MTFFFSVEAGYLFGRLRGRGKEALLESRKAHAGTVLGAVLALVAFLLGFTFGLAGLASVSFL